LTDRLPHVHVEGTGEVFNPSSGALRSLPTKRRHIHRWAVFASYYVTEEQAEAGAVPGNKVLLDQTNMFFFGMGCVDCELIYAEGVGKPCTAGDTWDGD